MLTSALSALHSMTDEQRKTLQEEYGISCKGVQENERGASLVFEPKPVLDYGRPPSTAEGQCVRCKNQFSRGGYQSPEWCRRKQAECNGHVENCWRFKLNQ